MDPVRYHEYTGGDYDRFYQNLLYLKENVPVERIRLRIPLIPHFHKGHEPEESVEKLKELGFTYLERFTYKDVTEEKKS